MAMARKWFCLVCRGHAAGGGGGWPAPHRAHPAQPEEEDAS